MSSFPLYDNLIKDLPKKGLTVKQKEEFMEKISDIDSIGRDRVYALIQYYHLDNSPDDEEKKDDSVEFSLPYQGKRTPIKKHVDDISWTLTNLPVPLQQMLYKFVNIHTSKMEEERNLHRESV